MNGVSLTMQDDPNVKQYYTTVEISAALAVSEHAIRNYIKEFQLKVNKDSHGELMFTNKHMAALTEIVTLLRVQGFTIRGAKRYLDRGRKL